jgi:outer membrane protein OmpA-like peptidoglycan-associated protein
MNLFAGYKGSPRVFEIETVLSAGWLHAYISEWFPAAGDSYGWDKNAFATKAGLNLNFNLGKAKAWTLSIKPSVVWDMDGLYTYTWQAQNNVNRAVFELQGGVTYHFKNSNGTHHFNYARLYDQAEVDGLNAKINALRGDLENCKAANDACNDNVNALNAKIAQLEIELAACKAREPEVQFVENKTNTLNTVRYVFFRQGRSTVSADQMPNVEQIATYLKNHKKATVVIKGYASPEGNADVNARIARQRAESVKDALVKKYGISSSRISADGQGVGEMFAEPDWNRVSICTIEENDK